MRGADFVVLVGVFGVAACGCQARGPSGDRSMSEPASPSVPSAPTARAAVAVERELQASRLSLPPRSRHLPGLAFGAGVLGRLREHDLQVLDDQTLEEVATVPLQQPRAVLGMADGALVALGGDGLVRWVQGERPVVSPRPVLFPGAELYPDARRGDVLWILEPDSAPPKLSSYLLGATSSFGVRVPEQVIELRGPRGGTFGVTREGVWLYVTLGEVERFAPSGPRLTSLRADGDVPSFVLPARRVDQSYWLDDKGGMIRALVSPSFRALRRVSARGAPYVADVGDEGRLLALVSVNGPGPRFELSLFDAELSERGRAVLPAESPTGQSDWVRVVTRNQELAASPRAARVAVGGPDRLTIFDGSGNVVLSK
jgi:hypothetical protein